jgi:hypothetical protein
MIAKPYRALSISIIAAALCLQAPMAQAGIVTTDQLTAQHNRDAQRARIHAFLERASVRNKIQTMGLDGIDANARVAAMSDQEVHSIAERIDSLPAGGNPGGFTNDQLIIVLLIAILVAVLVSL